jgi:murein DD-endopeptidase MepM/ murein hydrolase activator NlpD
MKTTILNLLLIFGIISNLNASPTKTKDLLKKNYTIDNIYYKMYKDEKRGLLRPGTRHIVNGLIAIKKNMLLNQKVYFRSFNKNIKIFIDKNKRIKFFKNGGFSALYVDKYKVYAIMLNKKLFFFKKSDILNLSAYKKKRVSKKTFDFPIRKITRISSYFGYRVHPILKRRVFHNGVDFVAPLGTPIRAAESGRIITYRYKHRLNGNYIVIKHKNGIKTYYLHMKRLNPKLSRLKYVKKGMIIGYLGNTGRSTGAHLHFGIKSGNRWKNPYLYFKDKNDSFKTFDINWKFRKNIKLKRIILKKMKVLKSK